jgi:para-nitrobenzyl esterase
MADIMSETFIAFARTGDPNNKSLPGWKPYSMDKRETMVFNIPPGLELDPRGAERKIFAKVPFIQAGS